MSWAYSPSYAKPLSVPQGLITLLTRFGMHVRLAHPPGYDLLPKTLEWAGQSAEDAGGSFTHVETMDDAFADADIVYPKSWGPYDLMLERVGANRDHDTDLMHEIERQALSQNLRFTDWICDDRRLGLTRGGEALYLHCLPADIGAEVTEEVLERSRVDLAREAQKKLYIIMGLLAVSKERDLKESCRRLFRQT